jgi:hypothetical protein
MIDQWWRGRLGNHGSVASKGVLGYQGSHHTNFYSWVYMGFFKAQPFEVHQNLVLFGFFCIKTNIQGINQEKIGVFPPLMIIGNLNTHGGS